MTAVAYRPKLIEVALPLAAINAEAARDKGIGNHPQSLHRWWARRPLAAARAVIWASLVDDPSAEGYCGPDGNLLPTAEAQEDERERLFGILKRLVKWENSNDAKVLEAARAEIDRAFPDGPPPVLDPFAGGGTIPLEARRLGLTALAGDLNPVAVLINKAMIEIPPRFAGLPPVHPDIDKSLTTWERAQGLAADVEAYGRWMRDEAERRIGHLYPDVKGPDGNGLTPIAWIWARTVESPDPSWSGHVPLVASWMLSKKEGKPTIWIEPIIDTDAQTISYEIREGGRPSHERTVNRGSGTCIATGAAIPADYIKSEGRAGRTGRHLMAVVGERQRSRAYVAAADSDDRGANCELPEWMPVGAITKNSRYMLPPPYGMDEWWKLFTPRQLMALATFSSLLADVAIRATNDAIASGLEGDGSRLRDGGREATAYADAVVTYLAFAIDKTLDFNSTISSWDSSSVKIRNVFARQAIPMTWDYAECNVLGRRVGSFSAQISSLTKALMALPVTGNGTVTQMGAHALMRMSEGALVSTDPPYYDNVPYADISDYFYVWLRKNLFEVWPNELSTLATPKSDELVANEVRAGSKQLAESYFESGMTEFMHELVFNARDDVPATVYYAFRATESKDGQIRSTGWDTFLQAVVDSGLQVTATWPMRTEKPGRARSIGSNALASSIVLAGRPRPGSASMATRGEFIAALRSELPEAARILQSGNIAPVDMAQSTIGPGIKVFSRYSKVVETDGSAMRVSSALSIINDVLGEVLDGEEAELDRDTRFALTWFAEHQYESGSSGDAESVAKAKNTSLEGLVASGIGEAHGGKFRLYKRHELKQPWLPAEDDRFTIWEALQYLVAALERSESEAADLLHTLGGNGDRARQLAYLLYQKANDNGWAAEANSFNSLITAWPSLREGALAAAARATAPVEGQMF
ncbi:MAG: DUF1156 domain-containing protein [Acidimicrobiaceae bacterium]|nr:DUF1156 domain-containing protein [Acidimicrobiaceae bacterium]